MNMRVPRTLSASRLPQPLLLLILLTLVLAGCGGSKQQKFTAGDVAAMIHKQAEKRDDTEAYDFKVKCVEEQPGRAFTCLVDATSARSADEDDRATVKVTCDEKRCIWRAEP